MAVQPRVAAHRVCRVGGLELEEVRAVDEPRDDFAHVVGLAFVGGHDAHQFFGGEQRLGSGSGSGSGDFVPRQFVHQLARQRDGVGVVVAEVFAQASDFGVHLRAAQFFVAGVFADGGLHQRRASQVDAAAAPDQHHIVAQARQIRAAGGGRAMHHRDLRDAGGRQPRLVGKGAAAVDEDLGLVHQVGAARLH